MPAITHRLWTPIANARDAFRRRWLAEPSAIYEHIWRLVHIHESVTVMLGSALATSLLTSLNDDEQDLADKNDLRTMLTGVKAGTGGELISPSSESACLSGSIGTWLDLLNRFGLRDPGAVAPFRTALRDYLKESAGQPLAFLEEWRRIGPVPETYQDPQLNRIGRFQAINSLRNKLAHVPISERTLRNLYKGLRFELFSALTPDKVDANLAADSLTTTKWFAPLRGTIECAGGLLTGTADPIKHDTPVKAKSDDVRLLWRANPDAKDGTDETWSAAPFVRTDGELKVGILFRLPGVKDVPKEGLTGEYHRFAAEIEPVREEEVAADFVSPLIPKVSPQPPQAAPTPKEPRTTTQTTKKPQPEPPPAKTPYDLRSEAETAFLRRDYWAAEKAFAELSKYGDRREYNDVAKLKHGVSLRRVAQEFPDTGQLVELTDKSISLLGEATHHSDVTYEAKARYELSRALIQRYRYGHSQDASLKTRAIEEAKKAAKLVYEPEYMNWYEKVSRFDD
ncbi:MAG: hypothetical protein KF912_03765 [Phycisphaeraceae bacterium]|nr:hypothetical protein [Phycisphaeraceae bacterium]MBX3366414.1 hypothetical protein [Phycisphaeraceae bacterium]